MPAFSICLLLAVNALCFAVRPIADPTADAAADRTDNAATDRTDNAAPAVSYLPAIIVLQIAPICQCSAQLHFITHHTSAKARPKLSQLAASQYK